MAMSVKESAIIVLIIVIITFAFSIYIGHQSAEISSLTSQLKECMLR